MKIKIFRFIINEYNIDKYLNNNTYEYHKVYQGNSFIKAIFIFIKLKLKGAGCMKLEWRTPNKYSKEKTNTME